MTLGKYVFYQITVAGKHTSIRIKLLPPSTTQITSMEMYPFRVVICASGTVLNIHEISLYIRSYGIVYSEYTKPHQAYMRPIRTSTSDLPTHGKKVIPGARHYTIRLILLVRPCSNLGKMVILNSELSRDQPRSDACERTRAHKHAHTEHIRTTARLFYSLIISRVYVCALLTVFDGGITLHCDVVGSV